MTEVWENIYSAVRVLRNRGRSVAVSVWTDDDGYVVFEVEVHKGPYDNCEHHIQLRNERAVLANLKGLLDDTPNHTGKRLGTQ